MSSTISKPSPVPAHVPAERVVDFDLFNPPGYQNDYHLAFRTLQNSAPADIVWSPYNGGHWIPLRGEDISLILADYERFSSVKKTVPKEANPKDPLPPITLDPPAHGKYRALIQPYFTMAAIRPLEDHVREVAIRLIEDFKPKGGCDFVPDFAQHLPIGVFMSMVDLPESDRLPLLALVDQIISPTARPKQEIFDELGRYLSVKCIERRGKPGEDLISKVVNSQIDGETISMRDAIAVCTLVLIGGLDTVASTLGFIAHHLATHPAHRKQLIDNPKLIQTAIPEMMRRFAVTNPGRMVAKDLVYKGLSMQQGDMIMVPTFLHGLDDRVFEAPEEIRLDRPVKPHSGFGGGDHRCPGANLAQVEIKVFLQEWLARIPEFSLKPGSPAGVKPGVNGSFYSLPLAWPV